MNASAGTDAAGPSPSQEGQTLTQELRELVRHYLDPDQAPAEGVPTKAATGSGRPRPRTGSECTSTNRYVIKEQIGEGGMGVVYRAFDERLRRDVALKVLVNDDPDSLERFVREQEITACLDHPNFVRVLAVGYVTVQDRSLPFYAMPLIRGQTLDRLILRRNLEDSEGLRLRREFTQTVLLRMVGQLCLTLQSAHDKRIIHRDLKPSNILIGPYGDVYVMDLGLAKFVRPQANETGRFDVHVLEQWEKAQRMDVTQASIMGTPYYMAPEQGLTPRQVDHRADIFGLGGILYFLLTGTKPQYRESGYSPEILEARRKALRSELVLHTGALVDVDGLLSQPQEAVSAPTRLLLEEYRELLDAIEGSEYHRFRLMMKQCAIIPPSEVLARRETVDEGAQPLDPVLEGICMKALAKDPHDRYATCRALWEILHRFVESV
jgi:serine/threonine protein kinase